MGSAGLEVVNALKKDGLCWCSYGIVVNDIKALLSTFREWKVSHTKRVGNVAAHELAKLGLGGDEEHVWKEGYPSCIHDAVLTDISLM